MRSAAQCSDFSIATTSSYARSPPGLRRSTAKAARQPSATRSSSASATGWPCVVTRCGWDGQLPIGVQIVARPWREDIALRVAAELETAMGGRRMPQALLPAEG